MPAQSDQSITQTIADIRATADSLDARLQGIDVGDVSDILHTVWNITHDEMVILRSICNALDDADGIHHAVDMLLYQARRPAWTIFSALSVLLDDEEFSAELAPSIRDEIDSTKQVAGQLNDLLDSLAP
ncbi:MAG: hypothetical protein KC519_00095 [Anaerolineae bacterium]|nr:hypothetical protein [Anaerolineae bacterium]